MTGARGAGQSPPATQPTPSHSSHASSSKLPPFVQPQHGPSGGEVRDNLEDGQGSVFAMRKKHTNAPRTSSASDPDPGGQHTSGGSRGQSYDTSHIPTNTEAQIRGRVTDREVQINAVEIFMKDTFEVDGRENDSALQPLIEHLYSQTLAIQKEFADRLNAFSAERQKAEAAVCVEVANLEARIRILEQENYHDMTLVDSEHPLMDTIASSRKTSAPMQTLKLWATEGAPVRTCV